MTVVARRPFTLPEAIGQDSGPVGYLAVVGTTATTNCSPASISGGKFTVSQAVRVTAISVTVGDTGGQPYPILAGTKVGITSDYFQGAPPYLGSALLDTDHTAFGWVDATLDQAAILQPGTTYIIQAETQTSDRVSVGVTANSALTSTGVATAGYQIYRSPGYPYVDGVAEYFVPFRLTGSLL